MGMKITKGDGELQGVTDMVHNLECGQTFESV